MTPRLFHPAVNCWAIVDRPAGTSTVLAVATICDLLVVGYGYFFFTIPFSKDRAGMRGALASAES